MQIHRVAIAGFGHVGRATADLLLARRERYRSLYGADVRLVAICGARAGTSDENGLEAKQFDCLEPGKSGSDFLLSSKPDILIEAGPTDFRTGGPGLAYLRAALDTGCDAIVISKGALVFDGRALFDRARASGAELKISGATAAALPTVDLLQYNLLGCEVFEIEGILNATTNYLLDAMMKRGVGLKVALAEAQVGGFAERDPVFDIEGWDTACKLLLLANFGLGSDLSIEDVRVDGIQAVSQGDVARWRDAGVVPKLIGGLTKEGGTIRTSVGIRTFPATDPLALVTGKNKAIRVSTDMMGEVVAIGCGAEPAATAAAALKDLEHILARRSQTRRSPRE